MEGAILYHLLYVCVHRVFQFSLWNYSILIWTSSLFQAYNNILYSHFLVVRLVIFFEIKNIKESVCHLLFLEVWPNDDTKEWNTLSIELRLVNLMCHQVSNRRINIKHWMTMIPCKLVNMIFFHTLQDSDALLVWYFTVDLSLLRIMSAWFWNVNLANNNEFYCLFSTFSILNWGFVVATSKQSNDFMFW